MKQQPPERTKRLAVIAAAAVILVMVLLIIETFRLLLPGLWTAFSSGDEQALSDYLTSEGRLRSFLTLWFLAFVQVVSLVIPAMPVQLAAGIAYGPWKGFVTSFSASVAANFLVFLLARRLAKVIELLTANSPKANKLLNSVRNSKNPWFYTILAFITPGLPNGIIPYAAAHANMKPKQFFAAVCISMPIPTLLTCLAGSYLVTGDWLFTVLIEGGMFAVVGLLGINVQNVIIANVFIKWAWYARMIRTGVMQYRERNFIQFSRCVGMPERFILFRHLLPSITSDLAVLASLDVGWAIINISTLSFLGLGVQAPTPEWGAMLNEAKEVLTSNPTQMIAPGIAIVALVCCFNLMGDALRDVLDPKEVNK